MVLVPQTLTWPLYMCSSIIPFTKCSCRLKFITATWCRSTASGVCGARQKFENFLVTLAPRIALVATTKVVGFALRPMPVGIIAVIRPQLVSADFSIGPCEYGSKLGTNCCGWLVFYTQMTSNYQICSSPDLGLEYWSIPYSPPRRSLSSCSQARFCTKRNNKEAVGTIIHQRLHLDGYRYIMML